MDTHSAEGPSYYEFPEPDLLSVEPVPRFAHSPDRCIAGYSVDALHVSFVARRKAGDRVYLEERESYRENGEVKVRSLRDWAWKER